MMGIGAFNGGSGNEKTDEVERKTHQRYLVGFIEIHEPT